MKIEYRRYITRQMLQDEPEKLFVFGDNIARKGYGGQAKEMRGEPNAVGIPTKYSPEMFKTSFFNDTDFDRFKSHIDEPFDRLKKHIEAGGIVVWPKDGIGTGRARLKQKAPAVFWYIDAKRRELDR